MRTNTNPTLRNTFITLAFAALAGGCQSEVGDQFKASGLAISVSSNPVIMGEAVTLSTVEGHNSNYTWIIVDEDGGTTTRESGASYVWTPQVPGATKIGVKVITQENEEESGSIEVDVLDPAQIGNQAPQIVADIKQGATTLVTHATNRALNRLQTASILQGTYTLNLSRTSDSYPVGGSISYQRQVNGGGYVPVAATSNLSLNQVGVHTYAIDIKATDAEGAEQTLSFQIFTQCTTTNNLDVSAATISIANNGSAAAGTDNESVYTISGVNATLPAGTPSYKYIWDLNGDLVDDTDFSDPNVNTFTGYSIYSGILETGTRNIRVKVWETTCNYFKVVTATPSPNIQIQKAVDQSQFGNLANLVKGFYYLQADIHPVSGISSPDSTQSADVVIKQPFGAMIDEDHPQHIKCDYRKVATATSETDGSNKAYFTITASHEYNRSVDAKEHGIQLNITDIDDTMGYNGGVGTITTTNAKISSARYFTDGMNDQRAAQTYSKDGNCTLNLRIVQYPGGLVPCANPGTANENYDIEIMGTFTCPLTGTSNRKLSAGQHYGAFYCRVDQVDACVGGGGGGGGVDPIPQ